MFDLLIPARLFREMEKLREADHRRQIDLIKLKAAFERERLASLTTLASDVITALRARDTELVEAMQAPTRLLEQWLEGFKVTEVPTTATVRDSDELAEQTLRELEYNLPIDFTVPRVQI